DLKQHQEFSGKKLQYFDPEINQSYNPFVIETSIGLDRLFLTVLANSLVKEDLFTQEKQNARVVLKFHPAIAPVKAAILPLTKKNGLSEKARDIINLLKLYYNVQYDEKDSIGKRYRRQDAIGTPFCITVDHQTLTDDTITIRHRDSMQQERVTIGELKNMIGDLVSMSNLLKQLM